MSKRSECERAKAKLGPSNYVAPPVAAIVDAIGLAARTNEMNLRLAALNHRVSSLEQALVKLASRIEFAGTVKIEP